MKTNLKYLFLFSQAMEVDDESEENKKLESKDQTANDEKKMPTKKNVDDTCLQQSTENNGLPVDNKSCEDRISLAGDKEDQKSKGKVEADKIGTESTSNAVIEPNNDEPSTMEITSPKNTSTKAALTDVREFSI